MSRTHAEVSYLKSAVRIGTSVGTAFAAVVLTGPAMVKAALVILAIGYGLAELLGVWEEWGSRGE